MSEVIESPNTETQLDTAKPWAVIFHNDNETSFDCVVDILVEIVGKPQDAAFQLTIEIHKKGQAVVEFTTEALAETLRTESIAHARKNGFPLQVTTERQI
jgi:ATP-dependent Clp protease adapter protein ClpS